MKFLSMIVALMFIATGVSAQKESDILGTWESDERDFRLEFFRSGSEYNARTLWGKRIVESDGTTSKKDTKNPDEKLRKRDIIGIVSMTGLKWDEEEYTDGQMYNPVEGKTYRGRVWIKDGKLYLRGYLGVSLFGKTISFHKYDQ